MEKNENVITYKDWIQLIFVILGVLFCWYLVIYLPL